MVTIKTFIDEMLKIVYLFCVCSINWLLALIGILKIIDQLTGYLVKMLSATSS